MTILGESSKLLNRPEEAIYKFDLKVYIELTSDWVILKDPEIEFLFGVKINQES